MSDNVRPLPVVNVEAFAAPPFCLLAPVGVDDEGRVMVAQPDVDGQQGLYVNGKIGIPAGGQGTATFTFPTAVRFAESDGLRPNQGETWGSRANSWSLHYGEEGFTVIQPGSSALVTVDRQMGFGDEMVCIRSAVPDANGYYEGMVQRWNVLTHTWDDIEAVWVLDANQ